VRAKKYKPMHKFADKKELRLNETAIYIVSKVLIQLFCVF